MKPDAFLEFADSTLRNNPTPAGFRSVTSRAYYGALHKALELLVAMGIQLPSATHIHSRVPDLFDHSDDAELDHVAATLRNLRSHRNTADYDLREPSAETELVASSRLQDARTIVGRLNTLAIGKNQPGSKFETVKSSIIARATFLAEGPQ